MWPFLCHVDLVLSACVLTVTNWNADHCPLDSMKLLTKPSQQYGPWNTQHSNIQIFVILLLKIQQFHEQIKKFTTNTSLVCRLFLRLSKRSLLDINHTWVILIISMVLVFKQHIKYSFTYECIHLNNCFSIRLIHFHI
jgi:hypothetical protein